MTRIALPDEAATAALAARLAAGARPGGTFCLAGDLGSGKTTFVRHFLRALGFRGDVPSPTFNLVLTYDVVLPDGKPVTIWHVDLYRVEHPDELDELGLDEAMTDGIVFVEWPDRLGDLTPPDAIWLRFDLDGADRWVEGETL
ncbi:MAG: tRNA (adenosine(37)-N6)-threonylcarbamoyltransferase complex ATPase subunit type 1 TsaE [Alphaproteobacteria bacterium]